MSALDEFAAMETPLSPVLDDRVYVEPKDRGTATENERQWGWVRYMRLHASAVLVFAVPNGTNIASFAGRAKVKREGLYTGFPDTGVAWAGLVAFAEWKDGRGDPSDGQIECLNRLVAMGHPCGVFRTKERCAAWLVSLGAPVEAVR